MQSDNLLIEFLTEELPPENLKFIMGETFFSLLDIELKKFKTDKSHSQYFVTPRRFGVTISNIHDVIPGQEIKKRGPAIKTGLQDDKPTKALLGFMKGCGVDNHTTLEMAEDGYFYANVTSKEENLAKTLPDTLMKVFKKLPIAKHMHWGDNDYTFVRPVHNVMIVYGDQVICDDANFFGKSAVNYTYGHRFMTDGEPLASINANNYVSTLKEQGSVIVDFNERRSLIKSELIKHASQLNLHLVKEGLDELLDIVTALVEYPVVLVGGFNQEFLKIPQECLILTMEKNQRYFALLDENDKLTNTFLLVTNVISPNPDVIINGNQKVLSARLADAKFFYDTDKKYSLEHFSNKLEHVVYQHQLGTQASRVLRLRNIAKNIANLLDVSSIDADLTASLLKADLTTEMVGEFPELQGVMGKYYAINQGLSVEVATAIEEHYYPRFSGDVLPSHDLATVVSLTDKFEILVGIFGIGLIPTGEKDPFALRRHALGVARILLKHNVALETLLEIVYKELQPVLNTITVNSKKSDKKDATQKKHIKAQGKPGDGSDSVSTNENLVLQVYEFILERLANYLIIENGFSHNVVHSVLKPYLDNIKNGIVDKHSFSHILDLLPVLSEFVRDSKNKQFFEANKRIANILKKNADVITSLQANAKQSDESLQVRSTWQSKLQIDENLLTDKAEITLFEFIQKVELKGNKVDDWRDYLMQLESSCDILANFFDNVMVMADDEKIRQNRLTLLMIARDKFNALCDIAELVST